MLHTDKTLALGVAVAVALAQRPAGLSAAAIKSICGCSDKQTENVLYALLQSGAVARRVDSERAGKGRPGYVYFIVSIVESDDSDDSDDSNSGAVAPVAPLPPSDQEGADARVPSGGSGSCSAENSPVQNRGKIDETGENSKGEKCLSSCYINNNTQENKRNKNARGKRASGVKYWGVEFRGWASEVVRRVSLGGSSALDLRARLNAIIWEVSTRSDLVDRTVALVELGLAKASEVLCWARNAYNAWKNGARSIWSTFTLDVVSCFNRNGYEWDPTCPGSEPRPARVCVRRPRFDSEELPDVMRSADGRNFVCLGGC